MIKRKWALSYVGVSTRAPTCNRALYIDTPRWPDTGSGTSPPPRLVPGRGQDQDVKIKANKLRGYIITSGGGHSWEPPAARRSPQVSRISETDLENSLLSMSETLSAKTSASTLSLSSSTSSAFRYFHPWQGGWGGYLYHTNKRKVSLPKITTCPGTLRVPFLLPLKVLFNMVSLFFLLLSALSPQIVFVSSFCSSKGIPA